MENDVRRSIALNERKKIVEQIDSWHGEGKEDAEIIQAIYDDYEELKEISQALGKQGITTSISLQMYENNTLSYAQEGDKGNTVDLVLSGLYSILKQMGYSKEEFLELCECEWDELEELGRDNE